MAPTILGGRKDDARWTRTTPLQSSANHPHKGDLMTSRRYPTAKRCRVIAFVVVVIAVFAPAPAPAGAGQGGHNAGVAPPNAHAFGKTYAEWSAGWWEWALSLPASGHLLFDTA